jgi:Ca2+-binding EF-hand superfamily protein
LSEELFSIFDNFAFFYFRRFSRSSCESLPVEETPQTVSAKRVNEINEIFALFENDSKPGFVNVSDLFYSIKCIGHDPTEEEMDTLLKQEGWYSDYYGLLYLFSIQIFVEESL